MSDIFISYSRKDSAHAMELAKRLREEGISVWIDQSGIEAATSWSNEIVQALDGSKAMIVLLSSSSIDSDNVAKELSLAYEAKKSILPVDIDVVTLPTSFRYPLAGIQRAQLSDFEGILRSIERLGIVSDLRADRNSKLESKSGEIRGKLAPLPDTRKSLMVLPFDDLSPHQDNAWFADGLADELIHALGNVKALRVIDRGTSREYKGIRSSTRGIANDLGVRYFIEGSVRKFGDQIKINTQLLDIEEGEQLWSDTFKGSMENIFDIQEEVARKVIEGLNLTLTKEESSRLNKLATNNSEAYELYLRGVNYFREQTRESLRNATQLFNEATRLDAEYAEAYHMKALSHAILYRAYEPDPKHLAEGEQLIEEALRLKPNLWDAQLPLSTIRQLQGRIEEAEVAARLFIEKAPDQAMSHFTLAFLFANTGRHTQAIPHYEAALRITPNDIVIHWNLVVACDIADMVAKREQAAMAAITQYERHLRLHPDAESDRVHLAALFQLAGKLEEARKAALKLDGLRDGTSLFNLACLWVNLGDHVAALSAFEKAVEAGFHNADALRGVLDGEFATLHGTSEFERVRERVERIVLQTAATNRITSVSNV